MYKLRRISVHFAHEELLGMEKETDQHICRLWKLNLLQQSKEASEYY